MNVDDPGEGGPVEHQRNIATAEILRDAP